MPAAYFGLAGSHPIEKAVNSYTTDEAVNLSKAGLEQCLDKMAESLK